MKERKIMRTCDHVRSFRTLQGLPSTEMLKVEGGAAFPDLIKILKDLFKHPVPPFDPTPRPIPLPAQFPPKTYPLSGVGGEQ